MITVFKKISVIGQRAKKNIKAIWLYLGVFLMFPTLVLANVPTPPSDYQISSNQDIMQASSKIITKESAPLAIMVLGLISFITAVWIILSSLVEANKTGDFGKFKTNAIYTGVGVVIVSVFLYAASTSINGFSISP